MYGNHEVIFVNKTKKKDEMFCMLCSFPFVSKKDFDCQKKYNVCSDCFLTFVESRKKEWIAGWRPSKKQIKNNILNRKEYLK